MSDIEVMPTSLYYTWRCGECGMHDTILGERAAIEAGTLHRKRFHQATDGEPS